MERLKFQVGDQICYPLHGVGHIEAVEERQVLGKVGLYYVIYFESDGIKVMVPVDKAVDVGMRAVISAGEVVSVYEVLGGNVSDEDENWNRRYRVNLDKLRTGIIWDVVDVVKCLSLRDRERGLSAGEKKMLLNARKVLVGELKMATQEDEEQISRRLDQCLEKRVQ